MLEAPDVMTPVRIDVDVSELFIECPNDFDSIGKVASIFTAIVGNRKYTSSIGNNFENVKGKYKRKTIIVMFFERNSLPAVFSF